MSRKLPRAGMPALLTSRPISGVPFEHPRGDLVDLCPVGDVARLPLASDLAGDPLEVVRAPSEEDAAPALAGERACDRLADPRGGSRDHGDLAPRPWRAKLSD